MDSLVRKAPPSAVHAARGNAGDLWVPRVDRFWFASHSPTERGTQRTTGWLASQSCCKTRRSCSRDATFHECHVLVCDDTLEDGFDPLVYRVQFPQPVLDCNLIRDRSVQNEAKVLGAAFVCIKSP